MAILRNSLANGNNEIKESIKSSVYDKAKTFDKIVATMLSHCEQNINKEQTDNVILVCIYL